MSDEDAGAAESQVSKDQNAGRCRRVLVAIQAPLETIGNLSFLAHHCADHPEKTRAYLRTLDDQVERIASLLREYFRSGRGQ